MIRKNPRLPNWVNATDDHEKKTAEIDLGVVVCACMCMIANWYVNGTGDRNTFIDSVLCITCYYHGYRSSYHMYCVYY